ncbi:retrovirus-related pol polyprotein from transposon TNT 1-94 [Tanacetum coccineum]
MRGKNVGYQKGYNAVQNVGNQVVQDAVQNQGVQNIGNQNGQIGVQNIGNGNVVAARAEGNGNSQTRRRDAAYIQTQLLIAQKEEAGIQLQAEEFDLMAAAADLMRLRKRIAEVHTTRTKCYDNEIFNMFTQEEQYTELLEPIPEPHQVHQNDSNVISEISCVEQEGGTVDQYPATVEETQADESLAKHKTLELEIERLLQAVVSQDIMSIVQNIHGMFRINPLKPSREEKYVPIKVRASDRTTPITVSQPHVVTKKNVNSDSNGLSSTGVDNTAKTRRPQPRSNSKNDRVPSASKSSCNKNKEVEVEEHHRNLLLSKNKKHMSSEYKHVKLDSRNDKVICAMCKQCLFSANHDVCMLNYVNDMNSRGKKQKANVSNTENQKKQKPKVIKPKKVGSNERLASPKPSKPRFCLRWSPTGRFFDIKGKIIASSESESQSDCSNGDNACTSNPLEPTIKRFPNSTSFLGRFRGCFQKDSCLSKNLDGVDVFKEPSLLVRTPQQNGVVERRNRTLVEAARTMLIFSHAPLFLWAEAIATAYSGLSVIKELIREILGAWAAKGVIGFFIGYSADSWLRVYKPWTKKIIETMNVTFDELSAMAFEQLVNLYLLMKCYAAQAPQVIRNPTATYNNKQTQHRHNIASFKLQIFQLLQRMFDELPHTSYSVQLSSATIADNVPNAMFDENTFVNPFATPSTCDADSSSSQYVDPSNMHTFYQPYPHEFQWTKDHPSGNK